MIIIYVVLLIVAIFVALGIYLYLDECAQLRRRLLKLGVSRKEVMALPGALWFVHLKELLYEKETELAEECFLTVEKDI